MKKRVFERHVRNFKIASVTLPTIAGRHNHPWQKGEMGKCDLGNGSNRVNHLPGSQLEKEIDLRRKETCFQ